LRTASNWAKPLQLAVGLDLKRIEVWILAKITVLDDPILPNLIAPPAGLKLLAGCFAAAYQPVVPSRPNSNAIPHA
jgi:hypothetical protein